MPARILIAEDDPKQADVPRRYLERDGHVTAVAHDGRTAIDMARRRSPDLLVLDLMLPVVDGLDVCRVLRPENGVPVIMLTARTSEDDVLLGLAVGADDYLAKPYSPRELVARVRTVPRRWSRSSRTSGTSTTCWARPRTSMRGRSSPYDDIVKFALEHVALRRTSENEPFPWLSRLVTLVRVARDGTVQQAKTDGEKRALLGTARDGDLVLAAWPGEWSQDVFVVDDLRAARITLGLPRNGTTEAPSPTDSPTTGRGLDRDFTPEPRLWERLAHVATLPAEGQRQVAHQYPSAVNALLRRSDLDPEVRARVIDDLHSWSAATVVQAGNVTAAEVVRLLDRFPDSASLLAAALRHPDTTEIAQHHVGGLSYDTAASIWVDDRPGADLAALLLPVVLTGQPRRQPAGYRADRYERSSLVRSVIEQLPTRDRQDWIRHPEHGPAVRRALLSGAALTDDELLACLPEITRSAPVTAEQTPALVEYVRRYPRLVELARPNLAEAVTRLVADGWSPTKAAQAGQWADLVTVARVAETGDVIDELSRAAVFDCATTTAGHRVPWREPLRYELVDHLVAKTAATDKQITYILDRLGTSHITELQQSAGRRSRLRRLTTEALASRQPAGITAPPQRAYSADFPTDDELSAMDDPSEALSRLWRNRSAYDRREAVAAHILASRHTTEDLAWRLPIVDLEHHPIWGARLADKIVALCGDSPARWQEFTRSWGQPTQLLATTLFSRLENIHQ